LLAPEEEKTFRLGAEEDLDFAMVLALESEGETSGVEGCGGRGPPGQLASFKISRRRIPRGLSSFPPSLDVWVKNFMKHRRGETIQIRESY
jgi:hypothetical protein